MAAPTNYYVDPAAGSDVTGDGLSDGTAWATVQFALDNITRDATNGDQINLKAGTADVLTAALSGSTYGLSTTGGPLVIRGYTSAANDGGIGELDGNGSFGIWALGSGQDQVIFRDLKLGNCGSAKILALDNDCRVIGCELYGTSGDGVEMDFHGMVHDSYLHDIGGYAIDMATGVVSHSYFDNDGTNTMDVCVQMGTGGTGRLIVRHCIFNLDGGTNGVELPNILIHLVVEQCSFLDASATGTGILGGTTVGQGFALLNNLFEGFSYAIDLSAETDESATLVAGNSEYNTTNGFDLGDCIGLENETLASTPYAKSGALTFANRYSYFEPVETGSVWLPFPSVDMGYDVPRWGTRGAVSIDPADVACQLCSVEDIRWATQWQKPDNPWVPVSYGESEGSQPAS